MGCFRLLWKFGELKPSQYSTKTKLVFIGIWWVYVGMLWYFGTRENTVRDTCTAGKKVCAKTISGTKIQIMVQNILYHYLVVLNVKIRNRFLGTLPALGTIRRSWKDELNRVKTSHPLWLNRSQKQIPGNSCLPENSDFWDISVNISRTRTS